MRANILFGEAHTILERALRSRHPVCMLFNHNSTMPSNDTCVYWYSSRTILEL